jgi:hypothetical protein
MIDQPAIRLDELHRFIIQLGLNIVGGFLPTKAYLILNTVE